MKFSLHQLSWGWLGAIVLLGASVSYGAAAKPYRTPWHLKAWTHRQIVRIAAVDKDGAINTGEATIDAPAGILRDDGGDIRIFDEAGKPVAAHLVMGEGETSAELLKAGKLLKVRFAVMDQRMRVYYIYFGNPKAEPDWGKWSERTGALTLETWEYKVTRRNKTPSSFSYMRRTIAAASKMYGSGKRRRIDDGANPFGPSNTFISVYRGLFYASESGTHRFGTDSDDASFLLIDGKLVAQFPGSHNPVGQFTDRRSGYINLDAGIHEITYYHVQAGGGTLARAGWRPPSARKMVIIPEEAFVKALPIHNVAVQERDNALTTYFGYKIRDAYELGKSGVVVAVVACEDKSRSLLGKMAIREWRVDGKLVSSSLAEKGSSTDARVWTIVDAAGKEISLSCVDSLGYRGKWQRRLTLPKSLPRISMAMELDMADPLLQKGEPVLFEVRCSQGSVRDLAFDLVTEVSLLNGSVIERRSESLILKASSISDSPGEFPKDQWETRQFKISRPGKVPFDAGLVKVSLVYEGIPIITRAIRIVPANSGDVKLIVRDGMLLDEKDKHLMLRLGAMEYTGSLAPFSKAATRKQAVKILCIDDALAGTDGAGYPALLQKMMKQTGIKATVTRIGNDPDSACDLGQLMELPKLVSETKPDLIILASSLRQVIAFESAENFERRLHALVDRLESVQNAGILLIVPPPVLANPSFGKGYSLAVKRVAIAKGLPVADAHAAFLTAVVEERGVMAWRKFYRKPGGVMPVYNLAPTKPGQEIIAREIWKRLFKGKTPPTLR
jgi:PA14 domain